MPTKSAQRPERARRLAKKEVDFDPAAASNTANEAAALAQSHLAALVASCDDAVISKSLDGEIRSWNAAAERIFGYSAAEIIGRSILTIIPPQLHDEEREILRKLRNGERIEHFETTRVAKDGRRIDISLSVSPIRDASGTVVGAAKIARDVTEQRRARTLVAQAAVVEAQLAALVASSDDAIISKSLDGNVRSWNAAAERIFGYSAEEIIGRPILTIIPPELHDEERRILSKLRAGERIEHFETVRIAKDGRRVDISLGVSPIRDASGTIVGAAKIARDVTNRKAAERRLEEEARALDTLNRIGQAVAAELDIAGVVQLVTDAATELSGAAFGAFFYNAVNDSGESYVLYAISGVPREAFSKFPLPRNTALFGPTFRGEAIVRCDDVTQDPRYGKSPTHSGMPKDHLPVRSYLAVPVISRVSGVIGGLFLGHARVGVFTSRSERLVSGIAAQAAIAIDNARLYQSARDEIAERVRAESALRRSDRVYRAIGDSIDYGIWICDPEGRNTYTSDSFLKLVGMTQEQCSSFGWKEALHPEDADRTLAAWQQCVREGRTWSAEHRIRGVDGQYHPVLARGVSVRDETGKVLCWAGINLDIADMKEAEDALREADRRKDEFLAILAHELRNPLAPMRYALAIARQPGRTAEHQRQAEEVIERQLKHMSRLLDDLLDVSRITHGTLEMRRAPIELTAAIATAIEAARPLIDAKHHDLILDLPRQPVRVEGDLVRLSQVFANLLINAAKYTDPHGKLELRAWQEGERAMIAVRDNGIGIAPEMLPRLFTLFAQERTALDRSEGGLGIGLALVKGVVHLHGGSVAASSLGPQRGSEFVVTLPISQPRGEEQAGRAADAPIQSGPRLTVLVADDNRDSAETCAMLLRLRGHEVHTAYSGQSAFDVAVRVRPQVLLLDIGMPEMNGYELASRIREAPWSTGMFLIAITGWGQADDKERAAAAGFDHHLTKPIDPAQLDGLLRDAAARHDLQSRLG